VTVLQFGRLTNEVAAIAQIVGLAVLAGILAGAVALIYRWYARERVQQGLPVLIGLAGVALYLNTSTALGQLITDSGTPLSTRVALFNIAAVVVATLTAVGGIRVGDRFGIILFSPATSQGFEGEVSRVVEAVGRVISVEIPEEIDDIVGYDPVPEETKGKLAGRTFLFPRRLTVADLENRLVTRLKADYGVGHVDIELAADGTVEYLAVGSRAAGIGPTLPPETAAVAVRADPAFAASAGDVVQVWRTDPMERVTTAELRGTAGDVVTLAVDAADTPKLDPDTRYRLITLPVETRADREFASLLRAAEETMALVEITEGSPLVGQPLGSVAVAVVALRAAAGGVEPLPGRERLLTAGDELYAVARPEELRKLESAAGGDEPPQQPVEAPTDADDD